MIRLLYLLVIICFLSTNVWSQTFDKKIVPDEIDFAGMKLILTPGAKRLIQADVNMIYANPKYLQQKIDRANLYFPIIERVFHEENFPEEFKYLALQESSLIQNAVSSSNAVGFWQFKKESAVEVGLRVDGEVDERMHIVYASRGASKYLKKNNTLLNNWVYALLSYNVGPGGVKSHVKNKYVGENKMLIDEDMHWYVIRFLAYKTAYEDLVGKTNHPDLVLLEYTGIKDKSLNDIAVQSDLVADQIKEYNKWCLSGYVPNDKEYIVIVPITHARKSVEEKKTQSQQTVQQSSNQHTLTSHPKKYPDISSYANSSTIPVLVSINNVHAIKAVSGDDINSLVLKSGISKESFLYFNELKGHEEINAGEFYYLQLKRKKALVSFHTVQKGESVYSIAQKYAITSKSICSKNGIKKNEFLKEGRVLWLKKKRPKEFPVEYKVLDELLKQENIIKEPVKESNIKSESNVLIKAAHKDSSLAIYHKVEAGETVFGLSRKYNTDSDSIRYWNNLTGYSIQLNQNLIVGYKDESKREIIHYVAIGETVYKISKQYHVSSDDILKWNNLPDYNINPGQQLKIYTP
jgi:membrane-bound lytic murein transglycosylase D